ncbi:MFS transporter [Vibrio profundum]|uniref:MFS transporter n=1 Tax=Vibrio profundum TaxID=2910247 RepID=UPI003D136E4A
MFNTTQKHTILFSCFILVIGLMGMDMLNPALPYIMQSLSVSEYQTKQLIVIYLVSAAISQFFYGAYSDVYGRKKAILLAFLIVDTGALLSAFAQNIEQLYACRLLTGLGAGGAPVIARAIISDVCDRQDTIKKAFAYFSISSQLSPALAPLIGAVILQGFAWRAVFVGLSIFTLIAIFVLARKLKETHTPTAARMDIRQQLSSYLLILKITRFIWFSVISALLFTITIAFYSYMPFILAHHHYSPLDNALLYILYAASLVLGSLMLAKHLYRLNSEKLLHGCIVFALIAAVTLSAVNYLYGVNIITIWLTTVIFSVTCGISAPLALSLCMQEIKENRGVASAVQGGIKMLFTGLALIILNNVAMKSMLSLTTCYVVVSLLLLSCFAFARSRVASPKSDIPRLPTG